MSRHDLTPRECQIIQCLWDGLSLKQAADALSISKHTVKSHRLRIGSKLGVQNLAQLLRKSLELGIISVEVSK